MDIRGDKEEARFFSPPSRTDRGRGLGGAKAGRERFAAICGAPCGSVVRHAGGPRCPRFPRRSGIGVARVFGRG